MKLTIKNLTPGIRQSLERTKAWLSRLLSDAEAKSQQINELAAALSEAKARRAQYDANAAKDETAATKFAGAEVQIARLAPQLSSLQKSFGRDLETMALKIGTVREHDIFKNFIDDLFGQLVAPLQKALSEFFPPRGLRELAGQLALQTPGYFQLFRHLKRPAPELTTIEQAREAINEIVGELETLLSGGVFLEIDAPKDPPEAKKAPRISSHASHIAMLEKMTAGLPKSWAGKSSDAIL
jgi:hypothetical protein